MTLGDLAVLLARRASGRALSDDEQRRMREQLIDVAKAVPGLAVFALPGGFVLQVSITVLAVVVLGGMGSITGSAVAAVLLTFLKEALRPLQEITKLDFRMIIYSLLLIILMLTKPKGLFGTRELPEVLSRFRKNKGGSA